MTIDTTYPSSPPRARRPARSRKAPARWGRRPRIDIRRRRAGRPFRLPDASLALNALMQDGDIYQVGRSRYLVAPLSADLVDRLILASAADEDDEEGDPGGGNVEDEGEPSLGESGADLESDGLDDQYQGGDAALGWPNEGSQLSLGYAAADESEPELGWSNTGPQLIPPSTDRAYAESDGDCDDEEDNEDLGIDDLPHDEPWQDMEPDDDAEPDADGETLDADGSTTITGFAI